MRFTMVFGCHMRYLALLSRERAQVMPLWLMLLAGQLGATPG